MISILADAGPLIALFDRDDKYHKVIKDIVRSRHYKFVTTMAVLTEVTHMLDFNVNVQIDFLAWVMTNGVTLQEIKVEDMPRIIELTRKYSDLPMDFADATLVIAAQKTGLKIILSIDSDFDVYRLPGKVKIGNVFQNSARMYKKSI
jgi:predicted nucleic acid-binding protein